MEKMSEPQFQRYKDFIYNKFGILIKTDKKEMIESKIGRLVAKHKLSGYDEYYGMITSSTEKELLHEFANEITINKTDFFREINHFNFIKNKLSYIFEHNKRILKNGELRLWSSASSTGEEPYSLAILLKEVLPPDINVKILATDISSKAITKGQKGAYTNIDKSTINPFYLQKYFSRVGNTYTINDDIKEMVTFRHFNLMSPFPFQNKFDIIFCRNVMIYFDNDVQERLVDKFHESLVYGGLLFIGHSESLSYKKHRFKYIEPTIYMK